MPSDAIEAKAGGRLALSLPVALALCILARPYLGLLNPPQPGTPRQAVDPAWMAAGLGRNDPAAPLAEVEPSRIYCAHKAYDALQGCRSNFPVWMRAAKTFRERQYVRDRMAEYEDDYLCVYQQVTPAGRRRAHLPVPDG